MIVASVGPGIAHAPPIPFKMCKEMVEWGYEKYVREHTLEVGWTPEYIEKYPDRVEHFLNIRMNNLPSLEDYLRHVVARQACDFNDRLKEITHPTLVSSGRRSRLSHWGVAPGLRRRWHKVAQWKVRGGSQRSPQLFHDEPG